MEDLKPEKNNSWLEEKVYKSIISKVPIICVDLLVVSKGEFLLGKRVNEPAKGRWFLPGGRVLKNESLGNAVIRKAEEELDLRKENFRYEFLRVGETIFPETGYHTVNIVHILKISGTGSLNFDKNQHSEMKWFSEINNRWHDYIKSSLKEAGFQYKNITSSPECK